MEQTVAEKRKRLPVVCDVIVAVLSLTVVSLIVLGITLLLLPLFILCGMLWLSEKLRIFRLAAPVTSSKFRTKVLLLKNSEADLYIDSDSAKEANAAVKHWLRSPEGRNGFDHGWFMASDAALEQELNTHVDEANSTFFRVLYCYPPPKLFRYQVAIALTYDQETVVPLEKPVGELVEKLETLGFDVMTYDTAETIQAMKDDATVTKTTLSFGNSTVWSNSAAQRLFSWEIKTLLKGFVRLQERVTWWTEKDVAVEKINGQSVRFSWFSHESHGSIEEMRFENWLKRLKCGDIFFLLFAGFTTILYCGLRKNPMLGEDPNRFKDLRPKFGSVLALILRFYCSMFSSRTGASNCAMIYSIEPLS